MICYLLQQVRWRAFWWTIFNFRPPAVCLRKVSYQKCWYFNDPRFPTTCLCSICAYVASQVSSLAVSDNFWSNWFLTHLFLYRHSSIVIQTNCTLLGLLIVSHLNSYTHSLNQVALITIIWFKLFSEDDSTFSRAYHRYHNFVDMHFILYTMYCTSVSSHRKKIARLKQLKQVCLQILFSSSFFILRRSPSTMPMSKISFRKFTFKKLINFEMANSN